MPPVSVRLPSGQELPLGVLPEDGALADARRVAAEQPPLACRQFRLCRGVEEVKDEDAIGSSPLVLTAVVMSWDPRLLRAPPADPARAGRLLRAFDDTYPVWMTGQFHGDGELYAVLDARRTAEEKLAWQPGGGYECQGHMWRLPLSAEQMRRAIPWQKTWGIDPDEIEAVLALAATFSGFLDVRDGGCLMNAVVLLASGDLLALRASIYEVCGFVGRRDVTRATVLRAGTLEELSAEAGGFLEALRGADVDEAKLSVGRLRFAFQKNGGIPQDFWKELGYRSTAREGEAEDTGQYALGTLPRIPLLDHPVHLPKLVAWAMVSTQGKGDQVALLGGEAPAEYEAWLPQYGEQFKQALVREFLKHVKEARALLKLEEQKAAGAKIDRLQEEKLQARRGAVMAQLGRVAWYVDEGSDLWSKGRDVLENPAVVEAIKAQECWVCHM